ncbi:RNase H domain-containing protein [Trichonephila clavipes]|nr:RNase H domain-containing protein [Trichonephila clavipes]
MIASIKINFISQKKRLSSLSAYIKIMFQWVPSHVNVCRNEIANGIMARECSYKDSTHSGCLIFSEIAARVKQDIISSWRQDHIHQWHEGNRPHVTILRTSSRRDETILGIHRSGHYSVSKATHAHILACIRCHKS